MRIKLIEKLIEINENIFFYPRLKIVYKNILDKNGIILDIGSNTGQSIDFFMNISSNFRIIGIEPNSALFNKILQKYNSNKNISIQNKGLSEFSGSLSLKLNALDLTSSFEDLDFNSKYLKTKANVFGLMNVNEIIQGEELVDVTTVDDIFEDHKLESIELLKIDVEGHELKCLKGISKATATRIKYIQLEQHEDDMYLKKTDFSEISVLLEKLGFREQHRIKHGFGNFYEVIFKNQCYSQ
jgi:FkbM family methyltransferase